MEGEEGEGMKGEGGNGWMDGRGGRFLLQATLPASLLALCVSTAGYNVTCIKQSTSAIISVLLGDSPLPELDTDTPSDSTLESLRNTISAHAQYWKSLNVFRTEAVEALLPTTGMPRAPSETPETGGIAGSFGRSKASVSDGCRVWLES